jgi:hypothetical protein
MKKKSDSSISKECLVSILLEEVEYRSPTIERSRFIETEAYKKGLKKITKDYVSKLEDLCISEEWFDARIKEYIEMVRKYDPRIFEYQIPFYAHCWKPYANKKRDRVNFESVLMDEVMFRTSVPRNVTEYESSISEFIDKAGIHELGEIISDFMVYMKRVIPDLSDEPFF